MAIGDPLSIRRVMGMHHLVRVPCMLAVRQAYLHRLAGRPRTNDNTQHTKWNVRLPISCSQSGKKLAAAVIWSDILTRNNKITTAKKKYENKKKKK